MATLNLAVQFICVLIVKLVKNMTDSDLLDMHYFLTEDDDLDDDEFEEGFYIF